MVGRTNDGGDQRLFLSKADFDAVKNAIEQGPGLL
jgi:hypothetical protein